MKQIGKVILAIAMVMAGLVGIGQGAVYAEPATNVCDDGNIPDDVKEAAGCDVTTTAPSVAVNIINVVLGILGLVAVFVIVFGGVMYVSSAGSPERITMGKNLVLYGIVGLVIALLAFAIVNFVIRAVFGA